MSFCPNCGGQIQPDWKVCATCGAALAGSASTLFPQQDANPPIQPQSTSFPAPTSIPASPPKKSSKKKWIIILALLLVGAIIIGGGLLGGLVLILASDEDSSSTEEIVCEDPYIQAGDDCCLDRNENGICDNDEDGLTSPTTTIRSATATTSPPITLGSTTSPPTTIQLQATTTTGPASSSTTLAGSKSLVESCVNQYGIESDQVILIYSPNCRGCKTIKNLVMTVESQKGYPFEYLDLSEVSSGERAILDCFTTSQDIGVPQLICPASGQLIPFPQTGQKSFIEKTARNCQEAAYT